MLLRWSVLFFVFLQSLLASAAELYEYNQTIRALGMGGVHILDVHDNAAMLRNPATLAYRSGIGWHVFGLNSGLMADQNNLSAAQNVGAISGIASLAPLYGKNLWFSFNGDTTMQMPYLGLSMYTDNFASMLLSNPAFPTMDMTYYQDWGLVLGGAVPLGPLGALGVNLKRITRTGSQKQLGPSDLMSATSSTILNQFTDQGIAYGFDLGYEIKFPVVANPTLHIMWKDVASTAFIAASGSAGTPPRIKDNLILGVNSFSEFAGFGFAAGVEYRHISDTGEQIGKKIHLGTELSLPLVDLRAGFYQGYYSYGFTFDIWLMQIDAAVYSVEKGAYPGQNEDKRAQIGLSINLGFDPNFKLTDAGGRRRNLKQRR